jgi:signal transduction histidine kinase
MENSRDYKFEILGRLALDGAVGEDLAAATETALKMAAGYVGLKAAALFLWNDRLEPTLSVMNAASDDHRKRLQAIEVETFQNLRREKKLVSAYLSFGGTVPVHSFSAPLRFGETTLGAVVGLQEGKRTIVAEDLFLEAFSATLALVYTARNVAAVPAVSKDTINNERLAAIMETAVTVNHEVNNPLTAILGNVQLLLLKRSDLDEELKGKLKVIEEAAMAIKNVTQKLLRLTAAKSKEYTEGTSMLDLSDQDEK